MSRKHQRAGLDFRVGKKFDNNADAWAEFQRRVREEGLEAFADADQAL